MKGNKKEQILQTALVLIATKGYNTTPISLIVSSSGTAQGLLYNFNNNTEALLKAIFHRSIEQIQITTFTLNSNNLFQDCIKTK